MGLSDSRELLATGHSDSVVSTEGSSCCGSSFVGGRRLIAVTSWWVLLTWSMGLELFRVRLT